MSKLSQKIAKNINILAFYAADKFRFITAIALLLNLATPNLTLAQGLDIPIFNLFNKDNSATFPVSGEREPYLVTKIHVSAYTSNIRETDNTPCITASGLDLCERGVEDIIATNYLHLPFGTRVKFPELYGDKVFIVHDRMNQRYSKTMDIWMQDYQIAKVFGRQYTKVEIF